MGRRKEYVPKAKRGDWVRLCLSHGRLSTESYRVVSVQRGLYCWWVTFDSMTNNGGVLKLAHGADFNSWIRVSPPHIVNMPPLPD